MPRDLLSLISSNLLSNLPRCSVSILVGKHIYLRGKLSNVRIDLLPYILRTAELFSFFRNGYFYDLP